MTNHSSLRILTMKGRRGHAFGWVLSLFWPFYLGSNLLAQNLAGTELIFPFAVRAAVPIPDARSSLDADLFNSQFAVLNPNSSPTQVKFSLFDLSGRKVSALEQAETIVNGNTTAEISLNTKANFIGWIKIEAIQPVIARQLIGHTIRNLAVGGIHIDFFPKSQIKKFPARATRRQIVRVSIESSPGFSRNTGLSIVYPGSTFAVPTKGTVRLWRQNGELLAERSLTISPNSMILQFVTELLAGWLTPSSNFTGLLELSFDQDVFVTSIQLNTHESSEQMEEPDAGSFQ